MRKITFLLFPVLLLSLPVGAAEDATAPADGAWRALMDGSHGDTRDEDICATQDKFLATLCKGELYKRRFRDLGLQFCERFPSDPRRWQWLRATVETAPLYWSDPMQGAAAEAARMPELALIDTAARLAWSKRYVGLRAAFMASSQTTEQARLEVRYFEILRRLEIARAAIRRHEPFDLSGLAGDVLDFAISAPAGYAADTYSKDVAALLAGLIEDDQIMERAFIEGMRAVAHDRLQQVADGREQIVRLRAQPFALRAQALDGSEIDLARLRGKAVLVDFWSRGCSSCLAAMPAIKRVYERYHSRGFEVIGICFEDADQRQKVAALMDKMDMPWPQSLQGRLEDSPLAKQLGFIYVPWTFLLDKNGLLVTTDIEGSRLEQQVRLLLGMDSIDDVSSAPRGM